MTETLLQKSTERVPHVCGCTSDMEILVSVLGGLGIGVLIALAWARLARGHNSGGEG
ncbi:MAG: hypothetical protein JJ902_03925 [Roseibium sp.]|nr:hypothetical protein [Roseibium sp.]